MNYQSLMVKCGIVVNTNIWISDLKAGKEVEMFGARLPALNTEKE